MKTLYFCTGYFVLLLLMSCGGPADSLLPHDAAAPSAPTNAVGESGDTVVELTWDANGEADLAGYNLYRSRESFSDVSGMAPVNSSQLLSSTSYIDEGLTNGTSYFYRLTAVDRYDNESSASALVEVTPFSDPPARP